MKNMIDNAKVDYLKVATIMFMMIVSLTSCKEKESIEPCEIPITEYSLYETGCWWINFESDKIIVINSNQELEKHIACSDGFKYPSIDFSKNTLLFVSGSTSSGVSEVNASCFYDGAKKYILNVTVCLNTAMVAQGWQIGFLTPKIDSEKIVTLDVQHTY